MRISKSLFSFLLALLEVLQVCGQNCPELDNLDHGRVRLRARGRIAKFRCWRKFTLLGPKVIICSGNKWSLPPPICIRKGCDDVTDSDNLIITKEELGAVLKFKCKAPLKLSGEKMITCDGKVWSAPVPSCEDAEPKNFCNFEEDTLCGWQYDTIANVKWKWNSGTTPTRQTGPSYDHTFEQNGHGHYMYMESSSPVKPQDNARLLSPYFPATTGGLCFEIWYHMWGQSGERQVGDLKVYIQELGQMLSDLQQPEFSISGNQGDAWQRGEFDVGVRPKAFRFVVEGIKQNSYLSDIAIDDPRLFNCTDDSIDLTTEAEATTVGLTETSELPEISTKLTTPSNPFQPKTTELPKQTETQKSTVTSTIKSTKITTELSETTKVEVPKTTITKELTTATKSYIQDTTKSLDSAVSTVEKLVTSSPSSTSTTTAISSPPATPKMVKTTTSIKTTEQTTQMTTKQQTTQMPATTTTKATLPTTKRTLATTKATTQKTPTTTKIATKATPSTTQATSIGTKPTIIETVPTKSKTTASATRPSKQTKTTTVSPTTSTYSSNITDILLNNNITTTEKHVESIVPEKISGNTPIKPLMIGVGVGIAIGLIIVFGAIYIYLKKRRKNDIFEDEMEPIAKNAVYD